MLGVVASLLGVTIILLLILLLLLLLLLLLTWYESSKAEYPSGITNPAFLRTMHTLFTCVFILGDVLDKLGIWSSTGLFLFMEKIYLPKQRDDPELFKKDLKFEGVAVRVYQPRSPSAGGRKGVMYFHGGGSVAGSIYSYDGLCQYLAKNSGIVVVSVGYRLAPVHRFPAAFDDCLSATIHFLKTTEEYGVDPSFVILCGDSVGGNLTAGVCQALVDRSDIPKPLAQVMIYPAVHIADLNLPSYQQNKMVPLLLQDRVLYFVLTYIGWDLSLSKEMIEGSHVPHDVREKLRNWLNCEEFKVPGYKPHVMVPFNIDVYDKVKKAFDLPCSPLLADDAVFQKLPKAYILTCEFDVLRDDGKLYKKRLEDNGVPVTWYHVKDGFHGIVSFFDHPEVLSGKQALDNVVTYIKNL